MKNIYHKLTEYSSDKCMPVIATVIRTKGSSPQKPGSSALYDEKGLVAGTVGGGAVEGKIGKLAAERILSRKSGSFYFDLHNDISDKEAAICGGQITILIEADPGRHTEVFNKLKESAEKGKPGVLMTVVENVAENEAIVKRFWSDGGSPLPDVYREVQPEIDLMIKTGNPDGFREVCMAEYKDTWIFLEAIFPPLKLVIAGAGHIGRSLSHLCRILGFDVTIIDDRSEYANSENIPDANRFIVKDAGEAMRELKKTNDMYVVIVTRGHKDDSEVLKACITADLGYLGMIGSRRKIGAVKNEFINNGWATPAQWDKVHTPIGLEINAVTVEEIAVSIAAELIMVRNSNKEKKTGCPS